MILGLPGMPAIISPGGVAWSPAFLGASLRCWLRGDSVELNGGAIAAFTDRTANAADFYQENALEQATYSATGLAGKPCGVFDGVNAIYLCDGLPGVATSADLFAVLQLTADPPTTGSGGIWQLEVPTATEEYLPFTNGAIFVGGFSTARKSTGVSMGAGYFSSQPRIVSIYSAANSWQLLTNGVQRFTTVTNSFGVSAALALGGDPEVASVRLRGKLAELLVVSPSASSANRALIHSYLGARYAVSV